MIVHIVLGKVDDHLSSDETRELSAALDGLGSLPEVQSLSWGPDFSGRGKGFNCGMVVTFSERLALFDDSMLRSTAAIDNAVSEKARALTFAMENHVRALSDTLGQQVHTIDQSMVSGIDAVRRTSDSITRQSLKAIELALAFEHQPDNSELHRNLIGVHRRRT